MPQGPKARSAPPTNWNASLETADGVPVEWRPRTERYKPAPSILEATALGSPAAYGRHRFVDRPCGFLDAQPRVFALRIHNWSGLAIEVRGAH